MKITTKQLDKAYQRIMKDKLKPIICDHCGKEVERWKACSCCEEK